MEPHSRRALCQQGAETQPRVIVMDPAWHRFVPRAAALVSRAVQVAGAAAVAEASRGNGGSGTTGIGEISVVLADDRLVRDLNARHRGRNKPTNVLSYEHPAPE